MLLTFVVTRHVKYIGRSFPIRLASTVKSDFAIWRRVRMPEDKLPPSRSEPVIMKLDSPEFRSIFTPELEKFSGIFKKYNYEMRIAGGAVRDILMGHMPKDLDFATTATPEEMKKMFTAEEIRMINDRGERHGTITARINDKENFEVTTLRIDVVTDGRHAEVEFTKDWKLDANRRDLTINSMFLDLDGNVYDYFYGYDDLKKKRVAFVGDPAIRIQEDFLRILRYFRFYGRIAEFPDCHEESVLNDIKNNVGGLERISGERIWSEWTKILDGRFGGELSVKMFECGLAPYVGLPKNPNVENFIKTYVNARSNNVNLRPITMISSLLYDDQDAIKLHGRLRLSAFERDLALFIIRYREENPDEKPLRPYQYMVLTSKLKASDIVEFVRELLRYKGQLKLLEDFNAWQVPKFPLNGHDLKAVVPNGKMIGRVMTSLKKIWLDNDFKTSREELLKSVPDILGQIDEVVRK